MILVGQGDIHFASMHQCTDAVTLKFWSSLPCLSSLGYSVGYKFAFLNAQLPRSSQIFPASLSFAYPRCLSFRRDAPGIGPGGGLYVSEMTQNGAIEFKKCSSKENGLEPRISTDAVRQCHCAKICQIRSTFFNEMTLSMFVLSFIPLAPSVLSLSM